MATKKKYFWLKLKDDFFNQKEIKMLRRIAGGDTHTIIYLKMLLLSIKNDGKIYYDGIANNMVEEIALEIDEEVENVSITFNYLRSKGLIVFNSDDEIELSNIHSMIGSESASASRVRKHRARKALHCNNEVTDVKRLSNTEIEKELDIDIEIDKEKDKDTMSSSNEHDHVPYKEIIDYLNQKAKTHYKPTTKKTKDLVKARFNEGFTLDDFKTVIDKKSSDWLDSTKWSRYLRPETLFGTKFESYLNEPSNKNTGQGGLYYGSESSTDNERPF